MRVLSKLKHLGLAFVVLTIATSTLSGCGPRTNQEVGEGLDVTVSIAPQQYFVERIGGERVRVNVMVEPGNSPATYEPKPEQLKALSDAEAYFSIGVPFENSWLDRISAANPEMVVVDTAEGIERLPLATHSHDEDEEERGEGHAEGAPDPHIWLSPELVKVQARNVHAALAELNPAHEDEYTANLEAFLAEIDALDTEIRETLAGLESRKFMVFHPAWGYFAHDFGLEQIPIEVGGQEPSAQELAELIEHAREEDIRVVFAQPEFSTQDAQTIAEAIDGEVLLISSLALDWPENLRRVAQTFAEVLER
jgi:zinc transport system substrate-binding protein